MLRRRVGGEAVGLPTWIYLPAAIGIAFVLLPLIAMLAKVDWSN